MSHDLLAVLRRRLSRLLDDEAAPSAASRWFSGALAGLILVNVAAVILESVESVDAAHHGTFALVEQGATAVFAVEYVLRLWVAVDFQRPEFRHPLWGRLRYIRSFFALVDLLAVLPALLGMLGAADFRVLRLLRLLRMLKLTRHSTVFGLLWAVFCEEAQSIAAVLFILCLTLTMSASLMYMLEGEVQPAAFSSIPAAMWWAIETLTTVGYGDMVPVTIMGKLLGGAVSIVGIATLALFTGLITVSFMDQLRLRRSQLRRAIDQRLSAGRLTEVDLVALERLRKRLGLPENLAAPSILDAIYALTTSHACPHCGHPLVVVEPPAVPSPSVLTWLDRLRPRRRSNATGRR